MSTRVPHPVGPSSSTPNSPASPVRQEVQGPVPADLASNAGAGAPAAAPSPKGVAVALEALVAGLRPLTDAVRPSLRTFPPGTRRGRGSVRAERLRAMPLVAALVREYPVLGSVDSADVMDAGVEAGVAARTAITLVKVLLSSLKDTERLEEGDAWRQASAAYAAGLVRARTEDAMAVAIAPIRDALRQGPRTVASANKAHAQSQKALAAQQRATKAQQRAEAAQRASARAAQAHADAHPSAAPAASPQGPAFPQGAVNPQGPAPESAAALQGPAVNPQGPAPGR